MISSRLLSFRRTPQFSAHRTPNPCSLSPKSTPAEKPQTGTPEPATPIDGLTPRLTILAAYKALQIRTESLQRSLDRMQLICVASCGLAIYFAVALILKP